MKKSKGNSADNGHKHGDCRILKNGSYNEPNDFNFK